MSTVPHTEAGGLAEHLRDKLRALAERNAMLADGSNAFEADRWRTVLDLLDADLDETTDPEGQPEGSERKCRHADSLYGRCADCGMTWEEQARLAASAPCNCNPPAHTDADHAPAPVPDDETEKVARLIASIWYGTNDWDEVDPDDAAICFHEGREMLAELRKLGYVSPAAHAAAVAEAVRAHRIEWADYIDHWSSAVGATPPTVESIVAALRREDPPFGRISREVAAGGGE